MPVNINNITLTGGTSLAITDASSNVIYRQNTSGIVLKPVNSGGAALTPMFNVGMGSVSGWRPLGGVVIFNYTSGSGYVNVNSCYNPSNGAFSAPISGLYLFKSHIYCYGNDAGYSWYFHPLYLVNGSSTFRRPGGTPYRIRQYGLVSNYGQDSDCCELIYLAAGDYVQVYAPMNGTMEGYEAFSSFNGSYISN